MGAGVGADGQRQFRLARLPVGDGDPAVARVDVVEFASLNVDSDPCPNRGSSARSVVRPSGKEALPSFDVR
jgi:hypothetical protein